LSDPEIIETNPLFEGSTCYLQPTSPCINHGYRSASYGINSWSINPMIFLRTTRLDNQPFSGGIYDMPRVDFGYHYVPVVATPTPVATSIPTVTPTASNTPTAIPTHIPGFGVVFFDSEGYFTESDTAEILVWDADLNTNSSVAETYEVTVTSTSMDRATIPMHITEVSVDDEYFTTSAAGTDLGFTSGTSVPYSVIHVSNEDVVTVSYSDASPAGLRTDVSSWYSAVPPTETPVASQTPAATGTRTGTPTSTPTAHAGEYHEDFESGASGWVTEGLWRRTLKYSHSYNHCMWYAYEDAENYDTGGANCGSLISPPIRLVSGYTTLSFWSREQTDGTWYWDTRNLCISTNDGGTWQKKEQFFNSNNTWYKPASVDLAFYAGSTIRLRFEFDTVDDRDNQHKGWMIDDISIDDSPPPVPSLGSFGLAILLAAFLGLLVSKKRNPGKIE
jgi:hypothetical protein